MCWYSDGNDDTTAIYTKKLNQYTDTQSHLDSLNPPFRPHLFWWFENNGHNSRQSHGQSDQRVVFLWLEVYQKHSLWKYVLDAYFRFS